MGSILVVEPDPDISADWLTALEAAGHAVVTVPALRDALPSVSEGGIDVIVIDAHATVGIIEAAKKISDLPDAPPIILASGLIDAPVISARIGAAQFLPTPCEPDELVAVVNRVLGHVRPVLVVEDEPTGPARLPASSR